MAAVGVVVGDQPGCSCSICQEDYMNQSDSRDSVGQSADTNRTQITGCVDDSLRTRIASVLLGHTIRLDYSHPRFGDCRCGFKTGAQDRDGEDFDEWWWERHANHVADAVILELGLQRLEKGSWADGLRSHRYITEWIANE